MTKSLIFAIFYFNFYKKNSRKEKPKIIDDIEYWDLYFFLYELYELLEVSNCLVPGEFVYWFGTCSSLPESHMVYNYYQPIIYLTLHSEL
jgi:hypothetical protein